MTTKQTKQDLEELKKVYRNMKINYISKKEITDLFKDEHNVGVYYERLLSLFLFYSNHLINGEAIYYDISIAMNELNLSKKQIMLCRKKLMENGWISTKRKSIKGKMKCLIYLDIVKLKTELAKNGELVNLLKE